MAERITVVHGTTVTIHGTFTRATGGAVDPITQEVTVTAPDGSVTTPDPYQTGDIVVGVWHVDVPTPQRGPYDVYWVATDPIEVAARYQIIAT